MSLQIYQGDITKVENVDAIVNAANAFGIMGAGVAKAIAKSAGSSDSEFSVNIHEIVKDVVKKKGPFDAGDVYISDSGLLKRRGIKYIYHAVTMKYPGSLCSIGLIDKLTNNVFQTAISNDIKSIALGGLGCGIGGLDKQIVAKCMSLICMSYSDLLNIHVVDIDEKFIEHFLKSCNKLS